MGGDEGGKGREKPRILRPSAPDPKPPLEKIFFGHFPRVVQKKNFRPFPTQNTSPDPDTARHPNHHEKRPKPDQNPPPQQGTQILWKGWQRYRQRYRYQNFKHTLPTTSTIPSTTSPLLILNHHSSYNIPTLPTTSPFLIPHQNPLLLPHHYSSYCIATPATTPPPPFLES
jgi:hypothetical protein